MFDDSRSERLGVVRAIDAAENRAREAVRVLEDAARFLLDDGTLTAELKTLRHQLAEALQIIDRRERLNARDTGQDVGVALTADRERLRKNPSELVAANSARCQEALRSLEEWLKLIAPSAASTVKQLRYRFYSLEKALSRAFTRPQFPPTALLYVLVDGRQSPESFRTLCEEIAAGGADVIQLRDKRLNDRELLDRAKTLRAITHSASVLMIVNDRPEMAMLSRADGVHVGQEELAVDDVRRIVGPRVFVGVSTHNIEQARRAVSNGADYIGAGPTFPSRTKVFDSFAGLDFLRQVAAEIPVPAFAIGGIDETNLDDVLACGIFRAAVGAAVTEAADPQAVVRKLKERLFSAYRAATAQNDQCADDTKSEAD